MKMIVVDIQNEKIEKYKRLIQDEMEYQASIRLSNMPDVASKLFVGEDKKQFILHRLAR